MEEKAVKGRPSTLEVLQKLKAQEARPMAKLEYIAPSNPVVIDRYENIKIDIPKPRNIPEQKITSALNEIERIEKKMHGDSSNYLSLYYDLGKSEEKFLKEVEMVERQNLEISNEIKARIEAKKRQIMSKMKIQKELSEIRQDYS